MCRSPYLFPVPFTLLVSLLICSTARSQRTHVSEKQLFRDSISTIKVWTYIPGDPRYSYYEEVMTEISIFLAQKGYNVQQALMLQSQTSHAAEWKQTQLTSLKANEAFLEFRTRIWFDSTVTSITAPRKTHVIIDPSGGAIETRDINPDFTPKDTVYFLVAEAIIFSSFHTDQQGNYVPVHVRQTKITHLNVPSLVSQALSWIPPCKFPAVAFTSTGPRRNPLKPFELVATGGYVFSSWMQVEKGSAKFYPGMMAGLDFGVNVAKSLQASFMYRRESTDIKLNIPAYEDSCNLRLRLHYILIGVRYNFGIHDKVFPYVGAHLGALTMIPKNHYYRDVWYFAVEGDAGIKVFVNRYLGFRVESAIFYQIHPVEAPFIYSMHRADRAIDALTNMIQWGFSAGVILRF